MSGKILRIIDNQGIERTLGNNPAANIKMKWTPFGESESNTPPLIPESEWKDRIDALNMEQLEVPGLPPTHDQDGIGQCNCDATTALMEYLRAVKGLPHVALSAGDLYGRINGGADNGSLLEDAMATMLKEGVGTVETYGGDIWSPGHKGCPPDERNKYRMLEVWICPTIKHFMSASLLGFAGVAGILWYGNYNPDDQGWLPLHGQGQSGGHALFKFPGAAYRTISNKIHYALPLQNSWRAGWSPWQGRCWMPLEALGGPVGGWWVAREIVAEDDDMPAPK